MALGSHCSCVVPEKRERSPGSWGLERAPAGAPRGRWRSTEIIDLFLLESCAVDATQGSLRSGRPAMGAFLASKPNPQYRATERAHGRGPGAGVCVCVGGTTVPAAAEITARLAPVRAYGRTCRRSACRRRLRRRQVSQSELYRYARAVRASQPCTLHEPWSCVQVAPVFLLAGSGGRPDGV
jgi:hypothetical protein